VISEKKVNEWSLLREAKEGIVTRILLAVIMAIILVGIGGSLAAAGEPYSLSKTYNMDKAEKGFYEPSKAEPNAGVVLVDAAVVRPVGLANTILGTGVLIVTLPFTIPSHSVGTAAWGLVGRPGGWTFNRPLGRSNPEYEEPNIFR
jgi:hypothetical protein